MQGCRRVSIRLGAVAGLLFAALHAPDGQAIRFDSDFLGGIEGTLNTSFSLGAQWRIQDRDPNLIGVSNLNPDVCRSACQPHLSTPPEVGEEMGQAQLGLEAEGNFVNQLGLDAPGIQSMNHDDGNLNYDKWEVTQAPFQVTQDLELNFAGDLFFFSDITFFGRYNAFHDFANYDREQYYPNFYTPADRAEDDARRDSGEYGFPTSGRPVFRESGDKWNEYLGQDIDLLDFYVSGYFPVPFLGNDAKLTIGEQTINWGESTLLVVNSLNTINPPNVNALYRPAFLELATVFEPVGAIKVSMPLTLNTSFEMFYQYDWEKVEIPPRGGFLSFIDVTLGADDNNIAPNFAQTADDPEGNARVEQQLLTAIADIDGEVPVHEKNASRGGQYGFAYTWFLPAFNNGTELRFYYANYHSRLPYFSAYAGDESCWQSAPTGNTSVDTLNLSLDCPNADFAHFLGAAGESVGQDAGGAALTSLGQLLNAANLDQMPSASQPNGEPCPADAPPGTGPCAEGYVLDSFEGLLEYPEDINLYGISFNTSFGDISVQGEVAYRPNLPLQVDDIDVAFAALQPSAPVGCTGANRGEDCVPASYDDRFEIGIPAVGDVLEAIGDGGDVVGVVGNLLGVDTAVAEGLVDSLTGALADTGLNPTELANQLSAAQVPENVVLSDPVGRRNAFPDFLTRYRGREPGDVAAGEYIQGYERFQVLQYNLGGTYIIGPGNWIKSNQIILFFEVGATHVLGFPEKDELQIEGPGTYNHASVGNDGTGAQPCPDDQKPQGDSGRDDLGQANSTICGPYQLRFNPTQQTEGFATAFSWGWRVIGIIRYENVLPGISFQPLFVIAHDVDGTAPGPGENFMEGRQMYSLNVEMRYQQRWSVITGVTIFRGAKPYNQLADRDFFQLGIRYQF
ncbi:hypothetical protein PC39_03292 [Salinisphaera sp. PC39]|uniref:DUF1302 domain-containing protein n=1 Tax=Salinisphaera sp. PC39 TaxID=1304156 RepID=UPI0033413564